MAKNKMGFTLVELMVVMAVIGLIAAMIFPNLGKAKIRARTVKALAELKTIELALMEYYADYSGFPTNKDMSPPDTNGIDKLALDKREYLDTALKDAFIPDIVYKYYACTDTGLDGTGDYDLADSCIVFSVGPTDDVAIANFDDAHVDAYPTWPNTNTMPNSDNIYLILPVEDIRYKK